MKLHLLDATYELFRAYHAIDSARAPDGREVAAVMGVVETTLSLLREPDVTHLAAATDHEIRSFRNRLWPGYKTEEGVPEDLLAQFPLAERAPQRGTPGMPSALSPTSASQSGIEAGETPNFWRTPSSS